MKGKVAKSKDKKEIVKGQREPLPPENIEPTKDPQRLFDNLPLPLLPQWPTDLEVLFSTVRRFQDNQSRATLRGRYSHYPPTLHEKA